MMKTQNFVTLTVIIVIIVIMSSFWIFRYYEQTESVAKAQFDTDRLAGIITEEKFVNWGMENWECGRYRYVIQIGDGSKNVYVTKINGIFSASNLPKANVTNHYVRQSLSSIVFENINAVDAKIISSPNHNRWNQSIDESQLLKLNIKQTGSQLIYLPIERTFETNPVFIAEGKLTLVINTVTYDGSAEVWDEPRECLNTEMHMMIYYSNREKD